MKFKKIFGLATLMGGAFCLSSATANEVNIEAAGIFLSGSSGYEQATIQISGPDGFYHKERLDSADSFLDLAAVNIEKDGTYNYQVFFGSMEKQSANTNPPASGQPMAMEKATKYPTVRQSGQLVVSNGQLKTADQLRKELNKEGDK